MYIRAYEDTDEEQLVALWQACDLVVPWNDPVKDIARKAQVDRDLFLVGIENGSVVASVMGGYEGHRGWINYLAVHPDRQRRGFGGELMAAVEALLRQRGCPKINLQVRQGNRGVLAFYEALGYRDDHVIGLGKRLEHD